MERGQFVAVIGPNGAGKTTLFSVIAGALKPSPGTVRFEGREVQGSLPAHMSHLGVRRSFQVPRPLSSMTVRENVRVSAAGRNILHTFRCLAPCAQDGRIAKGVDEVLEQVGLSAQAGAPRTASSPWASCDGWRSRGLSRADRPFSFSMSRPGPGHWR